MSDEANKYDTFEKKMSEQFPKMFSAPYGGICISEGWWPILESLCRNIQHHIDWKQEQKTKYDRGEGCEQVVVVQIKEKFGGLRFYYNGGDERVFGMVSMAESWAAHTCEVCGEKGTHRPGGWVRTLCDTHHRQRNKDIVE